MLCNPVKATRLHGRRDEGGAIAIITALSLTVLLVVAAMVLDFGLVKVDRQVDKSATDAAALAGVHAMDVAGHSDAQAYPYVGICAALRNLKVQSQRFSGISSSSATWTNGLGAAVANGCTDTTLQTTVCDPTNKSTWGQLDWTGTYEGTHIEVHIQSGYVLPTTGTDGWSEDTLPAAQAFADDGAGGCNQVEVEVHQFRNPTLGSVATKSQLIASIRSVGRVYATTGGNAPALLLLKRSGCGVLMTGSSSSGYIHVDGAVGHNGLTQPGSIHADSGSCSSGSVYLGRFNPGIVSYAAPVATCPTPTTCTATATADTSKPGSITSYLASLGTSGTAIRDSLSNVCGSTAVDNLASPPQCTPTSSEVSPGGRVTRRSVDLRYLTGVKSVLSAANTDTSLWGLTAATAPAAGYSVMGCTDTPPAVAKVFVNCATFKANATFDTATRTVIFSGVINPNNTNTVSLPAATHVYIFGQVGGHAINLGGGQTSSLKIHTQSNTTSGVCNSSSTGPDPGVDTNKAVVVIKSGDINEGNGGLLQMCYTTMVMMGSGSNACLTNVPNEETNGPTSTPCSTGAGDGQINQQGGSVDWTAPNQYDITTLADGSPDQAKAGGYKDPNGPEDLALWSESYGAPNTPKFIMTGSGTQHVVGVFMVPNADPFYLGGGATLNLANAQFVVSSFSLGSSNTNLTMAVDPNSAVQMPQLKPIGLVR